MINPCANDILGFLRECPAALSGDLLSGEVLLLAFVLLSKRGIEASMSVEKSVMLLGLLDIIDSERVRERLATVFAVTNGTVDVGDTVVEANDTRRDSV
jgi:hypothetical protein